MVYVFLLMVLPLTYLFLPAWIFHVVGDRDWLPEHRIGLVVSAEIWILAVSLFIGACQQPPAFWWFQIVLAVTIIPAIAAGYIPYRELETQKRQAEQDFVDRQQRRQDELRQIEAAERLKVELERDIGAKIEYMLQATGPGGLFRVPYMDLADHPGWVVHELLSVYRSEAQLEVDPRTRDILHANLVEVSRDEFSDKDIENGKRLWPNEYTGRDAVHRYLKGTRFEHTFDVTIGIDLPTEVRLEHGVIVGKTGAGKSQLLEKLILADLKQDDPPGMLIIDSKADRGSLFNRIPRLNLFHPDHGRLRDRLIIIDPVNDKPALNMFDVKGELTNAKVNQINSAMRYFFGGLLGDDLSAQMNTLFLPLLHVILRVPGATLHDLQKLIRDPTQYPEILAQVPPGIRRFLTEEFGSKSDGYRATKQSLVTRIQGIINEVTLDEMFSAPSSSFDVAEALSNGAIILVSTNAAALAHISPLFGKYLIAQMLNAGMSRTTDRRFHFYCDETAPYVDEKLATLLTTIRSYNVGLMLAFQGVWQMGSFVRPILSNTDIKFVSGLDETDAKAFEPFFKGKTAEELIAVQRRTGSGRFALQHRELTRAVTVEFPFGELDLESIMTNEDYLRLRRINKAKVEHFEAPEASVPPEPSIDSPPPIPAQVRITKPLEEEADDPKPSTTY